MADVYPWLTAQWQQLMSQKKQQRLPHALFFSGVAGLGKTALAHALAQALLCRQPLATSTGNRVAGQACGECESCRLIEAGTHPDLYVVQPTPPDNTKSKTPVLTIRINAIRRLCNSLGQTSQMSGYRVAIIETADKMNAAAANSLLKTLEEPGENTLLILLSSSANRLPVTIRSRCQQLAFTRPDFDQVEAWLQQNGEFESPAQCRQAFRLSHDAPLAALAVAAQSEQRALLSSALLARFNQQSVLDYSQKLSQCDRQQMLAWLLDWVNDVIYLAAASENRVAAQGGVSTEVQTRVINQASRKQLQQLAARVDKTRLFALQAQILQTLQQGSIALNAQLLWESLLLSWDNL